jgi:hypothetical protein
MSMTSADRPSGGLVGAQNQTAHEVTRDVTAWACQLVPSVSARALRHALGPMCFADLWSRADAVGKLLPAWARLGPLSVSCSLRIHSHRRLPATHFCRGRSPKVGVAERFPDWTAMGFRACDHQPRAVEPCLALSRCRRRSPGPCFLGSRALHCTSSAALARWVRRTADRGTLSPRGGESTSLLIRRHTYARGTGAATDWHDGLPLLRHLRRL